MVSPLTACLGLIYHNSPSVVDTNAPQARGYPYQRKWSTN